MQRQIRLLTALADMAGRSTRVQADLDAAIRQGNLALSDDQVSIALVALQSHGYVEQIVPLGDGGTLVSITPAGTELVRATRRRAAFDQIITGTQG